MRVLVIGSGVIGVTAAYFLRYAGYEVTVVDRQSGPGQETSFANGMLLHPSLTEPWNSPGCWRQLIGSLGRSDAALQLRMHALPALIDWGVKFLRNSTAPRFERNTISNLRLARHSMEVMHVLCRRTGIAYGQAAKGTLRIFRDGKALENAVMAATRRSEEGLVFCRLTRAQVLALEPVLAPIAEQLVGGLHYEADEIGDAHRFCVALTEVARQEGVLFRFGSEVSSIEAVDGRVTAVVLGRERLAVESVVIAAGCHSVSLLRPLGLRLPVQPAKGYSLTMPVKAGNNSLSVPVIDDQIHAAIVPVDGGVRIAGTAEFAGYNLDIRPERISNLLKLLKTVLPEFDLDPEGAKPWCGLRPMSVDGVPSIGSTPIENLFLNTGHGHLGWTLAAASAQLLVDIVSGKAPSIDPKPYAPARFLV
jgi:D-amino-acid dehydrogenase